MEVQQALASLPELTERIGNNVAHLNRRSKTISTIGSRRARATGDDGSSTIRPASVRRAASVIRPDSVIFPEHGFNSVPEETDADAAVLISTRIVFAFEETLEKSRAYRRAPNWNLDDVSYRSSILNPHALSLLSRLSSLSLGDVSTISIIALPLFSTDLSNSSHYCFSDTVVIKSCHEVKLTILRILHSTFNA
jgi:hypothetical protein